MEIAATAEGQPMSSLPRTSQIDNLLLVAVRGQFLGVHKCNQI